ncbi:hypothetical protein M5689_018898 [Euphorbia peplus]|nr:hypothetical protein M5689_018898 [Euphorbia peplus]
MSKLLGFDNHAHKQYWKPKSVDRRFAPVGDGLVRLDVNCRFAWRRPNGPPSHGPDWSAGRRPSVRLEPTGSPPGVDQTGPPCHEPSVRLAATRPVRPCGFGEANPIIDKLKALGATVVLE